MKYIAIFQIVTPLLFVVGCGAAPQPDQPARASVAIMTEVRPGMPLDDILLLMDEHLVRALEARLEGEAALNDFRRAEAISDRLLEARMPFEWIAAEQYSLEARLRQVQSQADRVLAMLETGMPRDTTLTELRLLRHQVVGLRETVAQGGTQAPPHIQDLLSGGDTAGTGARRQFQQEQQQQQQQQQPRGPRPIGTPVPPAGGR
jgi:hypothetical protein